MSGTALRPDPRTQSPLLASRPVAMLDYFRTPYEVDPGLPDAALERLCGSAHGPSLLWPRARDELQPVAARVMAGAHDQGIAVFARILDDRVARSLLGELGSDWLAVRSVVDAAGARVGSIWQGPAGVFIPFDPDEVLDGFWLERYAEEGDDGRVRARKRRLNAVYYALRPLLPRPLQIALRRAYARLQAQTRFPRWPAETTLHDFCDLLFAILASVLGTDVPRIAAWPAPYDWSLVLTHDVESAAGIDAIDPVIVLERAHGVRSAWNFVPRRYAVDPARLGALVDQGFEVGVHGLYHDGRDLESATTLRRRLPEIRAAARSWHADGFRAPATQRHSELIPVLGFDYDSSYPDTDPFEPLAGGCCSWLPYFLGTTVELPITLPQDYALFVLLRHRDETVWVEKARLLRARGGMALLDTHPDYLVQPQIMAAYERFLDRFCADPSAWKALPREVSAWWRRRASSSLVRDGETWEIRGPAAHDGRVEFVGGNW